MRSKDLKYKILREIYKDTKLGNMKWEFSNIGGCIKNPNVFSTSKSHYYESTWRKLGLSLCNKPINLGFYFVNKEYKTSNLKFEARPSDGFRVYLLLILLMRFIKRTEQRQKEEKEIECIKEIMI